MNAIPSDEMSCLKEKQRAEGAQASDTQWGWIPGEQMRPGISKTSVVNFCA
jgi:hypothetical protein